MGNGGVPSPEASGGRRAARRTPGGTAGEGAETGRLHLAARDERGARAALRRQSQNGTGAGAGGIHGSPTPAGAPRSPEASPPQRGRGRDVVSRLRSPGRGNASAPGGARPQGRGTAEPGRDAGGSQGVPVLGKGGVHTGPRAERRLTPRGCGRTSSTRPTVSRGPVPNGESGPPSVLGPGQARVAPEQRGGLAAPGTVSPTAPRPGRPGRRGAHGQGPEPSVGPLGGWARLRRHAGDRAGWGEDARGRGGPHRPVAGLSGGALEAGA